ncbi:2,3-bisphosphoglycerate-independent phosphoglycerate mutase, partial [Candidatus Parcubacteria bacterium]|nr:2,3-bisphosphoglycerate-independent phosphoglycerate mutase [Candidatus Parcubacteria bacterium]
MILIILDGWGIAEPSRGNAITLSKTPNLDKIIKGYPNTRLCAHGKCVGLPLKQSGNSEAGHINIGAGRVVEQDAVKICKDIKNGIFFKNSAFLEAIQHVEKNKSALHLMGMLSNGMSAHSDPDHLLALIALTRKYNVKKVYLHLFTDGRDSPQYTALKLVEEIQRDYLKQEQIVTVMGRFYAMDRKKKWERTEKAYDALALGKGRISENARDAITQAYNTGENDEFIQPFVIVEKGGQPRKINDGDSVIFFNLRSDRARQLAKVFVQQGFNKLNPKSFKRKKVLKDLKFVSMTDFGPDLDGILSAYPSVDLKGTLPMALRDLRQLYITEKEKHSHVTYFFNGGYANPVAGEDRIILPSPDVKSYDQTPEMNSAGLTKAVIKNLAPQPPLLPALADGVKIRRGEGVKRQGRGWKYDFTVLNFAAPDMIAHTGNLKAGIECCEHIDKHVGKIVKTYLESEGAIIITADHGNIEEM